MTRRLPLSWKEWWYSALLIVVYIAIFHVWTTVSDYPVVAVSGVLVGVTLTALLIVTWRGGYFTTRVDIFAHALVIGDLVLEAVMIRNHANYDFYWCALAYAVVLAAYRGYRLRTTAPLDELAADGGR